MWFGPLTLQNSQHQFIILEGKVYLTKFIHDHLALIREGFINGAQMSVSFWQNSVYGLKMKCLFAYSH